MAKPRLFLVRHPHDAEAAKKLIDRLEKDGFDVWSEEDLLPGDLVVEAREQALKSCVGGVVVVSAQSLKAWEAESLQVLISRAVQLETFVVPVLTGAGVELPLYLSLREPGRIDDLDALVQGIRKRVSGVQEKSVVPAAEPGARLRTNIRGDIRLVGRTEEIAALETWFADPKRSVTGVLYGPPGTGKTGLAEWWGITRLYQYPGGVFRVTATTSPFDGIVHVAEQVFKLRAEDFKKGGALSVYEPFARQPTLLILDNLTSEAALRMDGELLLPSVDQPIHILATSAAIDWSQRFRNLRLGKLPPESALALVGVLDDPPTLDDDTRKKIVRDFDGYPALLVPVVLRARRSAKFGRPFRLSSGRKIAQESFGELHQPLWDNLDQATRAVLCGAACLRTEGMPELLLQQLSGEGDRDRFDDTLVSCLEGNLLEVDSPQGEHPQRFRIFKIFHEFVRGQAEFGRFAEQASELRSELVKRIDRRPAPQDAASLVALLPESPEGVDARLLVAGARAFVALGAFAEGLRWSQARREPRDSAWADCCEEEVACLFGLGLFEQAETRARELSELLEAAEWADADRCGRALLLLGTAIHERGAFDEAHQLLDRSVTLVREGDCDGRVDPPLVGLALHALAFGLSERGKYDDALRYYERAAAERRKGDIHGRVDHHYVGVSVHQVGYCLSSSEKYAEALPYFKEAAKEMRRGDIHERVDHGGVGRSVYQVGYCLSSSEKYAEALPYYEQAATEGLQGDVHGRVDYTFVGTSVHQVGYCLSSQNKPAEALPYYERAAAELRKGDIHGRVDHESVGRSVHQIGYCLLAQGEPDKAIPYLREADAEKRQGDIYGRVDYNSVGHTVAEMASCLRQQGKYGEALPYYEEAANEARRGDILGRLNGETLARILENGAVVLDHLERPKEAAEWRAQAAAAREKGAEP